MPRRGIRTGFTLVEMLVVLAIISITLAFGMSMLSRSDKGLGLRSATGAVMATIRYARSAAIAERSPAFILVDVDERAISHISKKTMGLWHLEDDNTTGALGRDAKPMGGQRIPGRIGQAWHFDGSGQIDCGVPPTFAAEQGLVLECWVYLEKFGDQTILAKGDDYWLRITKAGALEAAVGDLRLTTEPDKMPLHQWFYVEALLTSPLPPLQPPPPTTEEEPVKDKRGPDEEKAKPAEEKSPSLEDLKKAAKAPAELVRTFALYVNDQFVAMTETKDLPRLPRSNASLTISSDAMPIQGAIDEVRVSALVEGERFKLPDRINFAGASQSLRFDSTGRLAAPADITLQSGEETLRLRIGVLGNIE